jgi:hypothetical protein
MRLMPFILAGFCQVLLAQAIPSGPYIQRLPSGKKIQVLGILETELHKTNERAVVFKYVSDVDFMNDKPARGAELSDVWSCIQPVVEKAGFRVAVIEVCEKPLGFAGIMKATKSAAFVQKRGSDGVWHRPFEGDQGLVPKQSPPIQ